MAAKKATPARPKAKAISSEFSTLARIAFDYRMSDVQRVNQETRGDAVRRASKKFREAWNVGSMK